MILSEKMIEALEILDESPAPGSKITSTDLRVIAHPVLARLCLHHLAEPIEGAKDRFLRHLYRITPDGETALEAVRAMRQATTPTPTPEGSKP